MSSKVIDLAPQGDLVLAIEDDSAGKTLIRVESGVICNVSPVFQKMLRSEFKEGRTAHDSTNPLELQEDSVTAMINLLKIVHFRAEQVDTSSKKWLTELVIVCDKYYCCERPVEFVDKRLSLDMSSSSTYDSGLPDRFMIAALTRNEQKFGELSKQVVRISKSEFEEYCHPSLLQLMPTSILDAMHHYRVRVRQLYSIAVRDPVISYCLEIDTDKMCYGARNRLSKYSRFLASREIPFHSLDAWKEILDPLAKSMDSTGWGRAYSFKDQCRKPSDRCECFFNFAERVSDTVSVVKAGAKGKCAMCLECFLADKFTLERKCDEHHKSVKLLEDLLNANTPIRVFDID